MTTIIVKLITIDAEATQIIAVLVVLLLFILLMWAIATDPNYPLADPNADDSNNNE